MYTKKRGVDDGTIDGTVDGFMPSKSRSEQFINKFESGCHDGTIDGTVDGFHDRGKLANQPPLNRCTY